MNLSYSIKRICSRRPINIEWFTNESLNDYYEIQRSIQECAHDHYHMHEGWEDNWPLEISLLNDGKKIGKESVALEFEPEFFCE